MARQKRKRLTAGGKDVGFDLTPMIDIVFQLIIFFMVSLAFVESQVEARLTLPAADQAKPAEELPKDMFIFNVINPEGEYVDESNPDRKPFKVGQTFLSSEELLQQLLAEADLSRSASDKGEIERGIIIRGDKDTAWIYIIAAMKRCQEAGFKRVYFKAMEKTLAEQQKDEQKARESDSD